VDADAAQRARFNAERSRILRAFGATLRELRGPERTQENIADLANMHPTYIGKLERGEQEPGLLALAILAAVFEVSLDRLAQGLPLLKERKPPP
jgi:transcriptional regulator with XRE-family HTH domain